MKQSSCVLFGALAVLVSLLAASERTVVAGPKVVFVDVDATPTDMIGDGKSWATAYVSLSIALALEAGPAEFWVAEGTYHPIGFFGDPRLYRIVIGPGQEVYGGFGGAETEREARDPVAHRVILSGEIGGASIFDNSYRVVSFEFTGEEAAVLDGVTVTGGYDERTTAAGLAGGISIAGGAVSLRGVEVTDNAGRLGGGIYIAGGSPVLDRVALARNALVRTGQDMEAGLLAEGGTVTIEDSSFSGGGDVIPGVLVDLFMARSVIRHSFFRGDPPRSTGLRIEGLDHTLEDLAFQFLDTGLTARDVTATVSRSDFAGNTLAIGMAHGDSLVVTNSLFRANDAGIAGDGDVRVNNSTFVGTGSGARSSTVIMTNVVAWGPAGAPVSPASKASFNHSILQADCGGDVTCLDVSHADPMLLDFATFPQVDGRYRGAIALRFGSPAVDSGDPAVCPADDGRLAARPADGNGDGIASCDIGAYELHPPDFAFSSGASIAREDLPGGKVSLSVESREFFVEPAAVDYAVTGGSAENGQDYMLASGTLTFAALSCDGAPPPTSGICTSGTGFPSQQFTIALGDDFLVEPPETVVIKLSNPKKAVLGAIATHTLTIRDDEPRLKCAGVAATMVGSPTADVIVGTDSRDVIVGRGGNDRIRSGAGNDRVCAGPGNDAVRGGVGADAVFGHGGEDALFGGAGGDTLRGGGADDALDGGGGSDQLYGQRGNDSLKGNTGRDRLSGGPGTGDNCRGGAGTDALAPKHGCEAVTSIP